MSPTCPAQSRVITLPLTYQDGEGRFRRKEGLKARSETAIWTLNNTIAGTFARSLNRYRD
jgi:hypothetical protein